MTSLLSYLQTRRSVKAKSLCAPGPNTSQIDTLLTIASRVPDHKKRNPFRFIVFTGEARTAFGKELAKAYAEEYNHLKKDEQSWACILDHEQNRFNRAPLVITVVFSPDPQHKVPEWEQHLTAGAVCMNVLHGAEALGFSGQWLSEWCAYSPKVDQALGLKSGEKVAGFIYIGTKTEAPTERARPDVSALTYYWHK